MAHRWRSWVVTAFVAALPGCKRNGTPAKPPPPTATDGAVGSGGGDAAAAAIDAAPSSTPTPTAVTPGDDVVFATAADAEVRATIGGPRRSHAEMIDQVAIAADGTPVSASNTAVRAWQPDGRLRWQSFEPGHSSVFALHGDRVAVVHSGYAGGRLTLFDRDGTAGAAVETDPVRAVAWSPDGARVVVAASPIVVYDAATLARAGSVKVAGAIDVAYAGDRVVYVARDGIFRWNPADSTAAPDAVVPLTAAPTAAAFTADGAIVYVSDGAAVSAITTATGASAPVAVTVPGPITALAVSPDNQSLAVSWKGGVRVFTLGASPVQRWERAQKLAATPVVGFAADGKTAAVSDIGRVVVVVAATGAETPAPAVASTYSGFTATGQLLVEAGDKTLAAYDLATGAKTTGADDRPTGAPANMDSWTYDGAGKALAWDAAEESECAPIKVWRTGAAAPKTLPKQKGCGDAVSPWQLGPSLVVGLGPRTATIWDPDTGKAIMTLPDSKPRPLRAIATSASRAFAVAVYGPAEHPDTGFEEGTLVDLYDLATQKLVHETRIDRGAEAAGDDIMVVAVLDDGTAYLGCEDGAVLATTRDSDTAREVTRLGAFINVADVAPGGTAAVLADNDLSAIVVGTHR